MGANQSHASGGGGGGGGGGPGAGSAGSNGANAASGADQDGFFDYYTLLQVEQSASSDEIRKSYRKLALKHHPDKNPDNVEQANKIFHKLQEAYEILSDDQERAWYDQNRERLMSGEGPDFDDEETFDAFRSGASAPPPATSSARGVTAKTLLRFFDPSLAKDLSDDDNGFYGTYRRLFERLAQEEKVAAPYPGEEHLFPFPSDDAFPSFGYSHTPYTQAEAGVHQVPIKDFYSVWTNFQSRKSFGWMDQHDLRDAPERRVKRWMEKENKRGRELARREYNDTIRSLAAFVRKRDPRFRAWQEYQNENGPNSAAGIARRQAEAERIKREREERARSFQAQSWQVAGNAAYTDSEFSEGEEGDDGEDDDDQEDDEEHSAGSAQRSDEEDGVNDRSAVENSADPVKGLSSDAWDCVACDKFFRSEPAFRNHERSAKHKKAVAALRRKMLEEDDELGLGLDGDDDGHIDRDSIDAVPLSEDVRAMGLQDYAADSGDEALSAPTADPASESKAKKQKKKAARQQQKQGHDALRDDGFEYSAGFSIPAMPAASGSKSKKQKKKDKKRREMENAAAGMGMDDDGFFVQDLNQAKGREPDRTGMDSEDGDEPNGTSAAVAGTGAGAEERAGGLDPQDLWAGLVDPDIPPEAFVTPVPGPLGPGQRPAGSFDVFGYGSLIFKPPPYVIGATPGFIKGFARRFAQSSIDHRGTPQRPGRVATLVSASDWHRFKDADDAPEGDIVWGVSYTIDPEHAETVRAYLDYREKNGYTARSVDIWGIRKVGQTTISSIDEAGHSEIEDEAESGREDEEVVIVNDALVYVGLPDNEAFVGPQPLPALARRIYSCQGPSGRNDEYLLNLARAIRSLAPQSVDAHLFELERLVLDLQARDGAATPDDLVDPSNEISEGGANTGRKARRSKKEKAAAAAKERCNVCAAPFDSRSKLFNHIRETGHALAGTAQQQQQLGAEMDEEERGAGRKKRGKKAR